MFWFNAFKGPDIKDENNQVIPLENIPWTEGHVYLIYDAENENNAISSTDTITYLNGQLYVDVADNANQPRRIKLGSTYTPSEPDTPGEGGGSEGTVSSEKVESKQFKGIINTNNRIAYTDSLDNVTYEKLKKAIFYVPDDEDNNLYYLPIFTAEGPNGAWSCGPGEDDTFTFYYADDSDIGSRKTAFYLYPDGALAAQQFYASIGNDYAEYRTIADEAMAGQCVVEIGDGGLKLATSRLQPGANIISDTYGSAIGKNHTNKQPLAVAGRVLAYPYEPLETYHAGDPICSGPNGTVSKMTREEVQQYPDRMIGTVSEIPTYEKWGSNVNVDGRIWIKL